ncbi:MAG TPA: hypothetical protein VIE44_02120 [Methylomirabilota bacterium]
MELAAGLILTGLCGMLAALQALWPRLGRRARLAAVAVLPFGLGMYAEARFCYHTQWILILPPDGRARYPALWEHGTPLEPTAGFRPWTDERWSLYPVLRTGLHRGNEP